MPHRPDLTENVRTVGLVSSFIAVVANRSRLCWRIEKRLARLDQVHDRTEFSFWLSPSCSASRILLSYGLTA
jgi:hypothetical protein